MNEILILFIYKGNPRNENSLKKNIQQGEAANVPYKQRNLNKLLNKILL
jgi:hypothetical protein